MVTANGIKLGSAGALLTAGIMMLGSACGEAPQADPGKLLFECGELRATDICVMNADASGLTDLSTKSGEYCSDLVFSPKGARIACDTSEGVVVMNGDGSDAKTIGEPPGGGPAWSPDGSQLAYEALTRGIYVVDADGARTRRVADEQAAYGLSWSPDGRKIAYGTGLFGDRRDRLIVVSADGFTRRTLSTAVDGPWRPAWSPDGTTIAFLAGPYGNEVYVISAGGGSPRRLASGGRSLGVTPAWSPDSKTILFERNDQVATVAAAGGPAKLLTSSAFGEEATQPAWSPDGGRIVYLRGRHPARFFGADSDSDLWVMNADGSGKHEITNALAQDGGVNSGPRWAPGHVSPAAAPVFASRPLSISSTRVLPLRDLVGLVVANGTRATFSVQTDAYSCDLSGWDVRLRSRLTFRGASNGCGEDSALDELAIANARTAWILSFDLDKAQLLVAPRRAARPRLVAGGAGWTAGGGFEGDSLGHLKSEGSLTVFNTWRESASGRVTRARLWRVAGSSRRLIRAGPDAVPATAVDRGRIVIARRGGHIIILRANGSIVRTFKLAGMAIASPRLHASRLYVVRSDRLEAYDLLGRMRRSWPLQRGFFSGPKLVGVDGRFAVYLAGIAIHVLRLADGADRVLVLRNQCPTADLGLGRPAAVALEPTGLFFGYNETYTAMPGRVVFVPRRELLAQFGR
jgi:TolB protein